MMARVHGNWCGPNWTAGQVKPASAITRADMKVKCLDKLDCGCKQHDITIGTKGHSFKADEKLRKVADREALKVWRPVYALKAAIVAQAMATSRWFRG